MTSQGAYTLREISKLLGIAENKIRYWERRGLLTPSVEAQDGRRYSFQDLICLRTLVGLLGQGVTERRIIRSVASLKKTLPQVSRPLSELRILVDRNSRVLVKHKNALFDPRGQLVLSFEA